MIRAVIFDVDNVLVDMDKTHYDALNQALKEVRGFTVSKELHEELLKGLPTTKKLWALTVKYNFTPEEMDKINQLKQEYTLANMVIEPTETTERMFRGLSDKYKLFACSNAIHRTTYEMLRRVGALNWLQEFLSADSVKNPKPAPDIYKEAFRRLGLQPEECLVVEDSPVGKAAALASGAHLCAVMDSYDVNLERIEKEIDSIGKIHIVIPMAGAGKRFADKGYTFPKPLIDVKGQPMIQHVVENIALKGQYIFICQESENKKYRIESMLERLAPGCFVQQLRGVTEGALCSVLSAKDYFSDNDELVIANSDQLIEGSVAKFVETMRAAGADGGMITFTNTHPKWSYAEVTDDRVVRVAEKDPISTNATVGIYYYRAALEFIKYAEQMIEKNIRVNGEFYVCPVFNEYIEDGKLIKTYPVDKMIGLGTPEDLETYLK